MESPFYLNQLYPFQDQVLRVFSTLDTQFHLSGGTALSRGYLNHRFSDDLVLCSATQTDWELVRWIKAPDLKQYIDQLNDLGKGLIFP